MGRAGPHGALSEEKSLLLIRGKRQESNRSRSLSEFSLLPAGALGRVVPECSDGDDLFLDRVLCSSVDDER